MAQYKAIIWGAGQSAQSLIDREGDALSPLIRVTPEEKAGFVLPEAIRSLTFDQLIIASSSVAAILPDVRALGIPDDKIYWHFWERQRVISLAEYGAVFLSAQDILYAFYDLAVNNANFDACGFAIRAEIRCRRLGLKGVHYVIVPSDTRHGGNPGDHERYGRDDVIYWRKVYIVEALFRLLPSTLGISNLSMRSDVTRYISSDLTTFPDGYTPDCPQISFRVRDLWRDCISPDDLFHGTAPPLAQEQIARWLSPRAQGRRVISVTLREYTYQAVRNSNIDAWLQFARWLDPQQYCVVFIRDTYKVFEPFPMSPETPVHVCDLAATDLNARMALYEACDLNMGVISGPVILLYLSRARYLLFKIMYDGYNNLSLEYQERMDGITHGEGYPFAQSGQMMVWEEDTLTNLQTHFRTFAQRQGW